MKILHYSDRRDEKFSNLYDQCDAVFLTGDLTFFDLNVLESKQTKKPIFGVYGNHDSGLYMDELGIENVHNKVVNFFGSKLGGFQGCVKYKETGVMFTEEEAAEFANTFPAVDILLLHAGPKSMLDDQTDEVHTGSESIARYVLEKKPKYVFVGHQYSDDEKVIGETKLYRTYGARIIEIN